LRRKTQEGLHAMDALHGDHLLSIDGQPFTKHLRSIDTKRCFQYVLMTLKDDVPVYVVMDEERKCRDYPGSDVEPWVAGEYLLPAFAICKGTVHYRSDWWPTMFAKWAVEHNFVRPQEIKYVLPASHSHSAAVFNDHAKYVWENFPEAKHIINHQVGIWGRRRERFTKVRATTQWETVCAMINEYPESQTQKFSVHQVGDVAFMRLTTEHELLDGHLPLWRQVIAGSIMNIDRMYNDIVGPKTIVYGYNTDSIKCARPLPFEAGKTPGAYWNESTANLGGSSIVAESDGWQPTELKYNQIDMNDAKSALQGCSVSGPCGSGKTRVLA
jgi:hypothetical protein